MIKNFKLDFLYKRLFTTILASFVVIFLLFSTNSFAANSNDLLLLKAISSNNLENVRKLLTGDNVNFQSVESFYGFPSAKMAKLILENVEKPAGSNKFLDLILQVSCNGWNSETQKRETSDEFVELRNQLVELALKNGANSTRLVETVITKEVPLTENNWLTITLPKSEELLKIALAHGAKFSDVKIYVDGYGKLPLVEEAKFMLENSLDPNKFLNSILRIDCTKWNSEKQITETNDELVEQRNKLVELALDKGADANQLLEAILSKELPSSGNNWRTITLPRSEELMEVSLRKGARFADVKLRNFSELPSLEHAEFMLENSLDPNKFLAAIFISSVIRYDHERNTLQASEELLELKLKLIKLALEKGADPNNLMNSVHIGNIMYLIGEGGHGSIEMLFDNNYKKLDPELFCRKLNDNLNDRWTENNLDYLLHAPQSILDMKYKNINVKPSSSPRIPRMIHHIWLTNEKVKKELLAEDIENVLKTKALFSQSGKSWEHVVWVNDKNLIPNSVKKLEENGIKVREISEVNNNFILRNKIDELIAQGRWGMATDTLRYELLKHFGGVYADLNYIFVRGVESEIHKYDFFSQTYESEGGYWIDNFFFGCTPNHPVLIDLVNLVQRNFYNPPKYISSLGEKGSSGITDATTADPMASAYYRSAHKNGTIDVVYPYISPDDIDTRDHQSIIFLENDNKQVPASIKRISQRYLNCPQIVNHATKQLEFGAYVRENDICGTEDHLIGADSKNGGTWVNSEWDSS